jgi:hypothetical protein
MIQQIKDLLFAVPFLPFKIRASNGRKYMVPSGGHAIVSPTFSSVSVYDDEGIVHIISSLHIASVEGPEAMA